MVRKVTRSILFLSFVGTILVSLVLAQDVKKPSIEDQLNEIINSQKTINQRLSTIEAKQMGILQIIQRGAGPGLAQAPRLPSDDMNKQYTIDVGNSSINGNKDAKITIVEFSDFQCPFSQRFHPMVPPILKAYPKDVSYILKNFPLQFHPNARPAAKASLAAREQGKYWEMVEALFQNGHDLSEDKYAELAKQIGLNVDKFKKDLKEKDAQWEKLIQEDMTVANSCNVQGTPTFFINGKITSARDEASLKAAVEKILNAGK